MNPGGRVDKILCKVLTAGVGSGRRRWRCWPNGVKAKAAPRRQENPEAKWSGNREEKVKKTFEIWTRSGWASSNTSLKPNALVDQTEFERHPVVFGLARVR